MTWPFFLFALVVAVLLQTTLVRLAPSGMLDLPLFLALAAGLLMPTYDARLAAWTAGLAQSLETLGPLGPHAFALGLAGWALTRLREGVNLRVWWGRFAITFLAGFSGLALLRLYQTAYLQLKFETTLQPFIDAAILAGVGAILLTVLTSYRPIRRRMLRADQGIGRR